MALITKKILYITLFYVIATALRYYFYVLKPDFLYILNDDIYGLLTGIGPLIGGLVLVKIFNRDNEIMLWSFGVWQTSVLFLVPVILFFFLGFLNYNQPNYSSLKIVGLAVIYACFEEYGWRGYLQTELKGLNKFFKYFLISVLWFFWHFDFNYIFDFQFIINFALILGGSIGMGFIADKSKSLILVALFHAFINILIQDNFGKGLQKPIILIISGISIIIWMIIKGKKDKNYLLLQTKVPKA